MALKESRTSQVPAASPSARSDAAEPHGGTHAQPKQIVLNVELAPALLERIRQAVPGATVVTKSELASDPALLERADILFTQQIDAGRVAQAKQLRWVQSYGAGVEWLLTEAVIARDDLRITNARGIHAQPIAEHVFGLILAFARRLDGSILQQQERTWSPGALTSSLRTLEHKTLGIVGLGAIGRRIAELGKAFGMRVVGTRQSGQATSSVDRTFTPDGLGEVLAQSDYIVNALPLTLATRRVFDRAAFARTKPDAVFVNIGRGGSVDTEALVEALRTSRVGGALLDVTDPEPLPREHVLWTLPNVIITPHYSGAHPGYTERITAIFLDNLGRYRSGQPLVNLVDKNAGY
jgi:D-2-hydroxyacid dehydrogenase (NADP+)